MKYYYTDPLASAWMAKYFGINYSQDSFFVWHVTSGDMELGADHKKLYIHPDSLHLLEPQVGDLVTAKNDFVQYVAFVEKDGLHKCNTHFPDVILTENGDCPFKVTSIIQRNGIAFMMPEVEE